MNNEIPLINPSTLYAGTISVYDGIWNDYAETIQDLEDYSNDEQTKYSFEPATTFDKSLSIRTNYDMYLNDAAGDDERMKNIADKFYTLLYATSVGYNRYFEIDEPVFFNEGLNVLKYQTGQEYGAHYDGGSSTGRTIAAILYLNDDYEGGEIEFVNFGIKMKPTKGTLILFPATFPYRHIAHPVISGTKYAIVTWLHDRPVDDISTKTTVG